MEEKNNEFDTTKGVSLTPSVTRLLQPTADYLGEELKQGIQNGLEFIKNKFKQKNLEKHLEVVSNRINAESQSELSFRHLDFFTDWCKDAENIDPEDPMLSSIWQQLLLEIFNGKEYEKKILHALKSLDSHEAKFLLKIARSKIFLARSEEEKFAAKSLLLKNLIKKELYLSNIFLTITLLAVGAGALTGAYINIFTNSRIVDPFLKIYIITFVPCLFTLSIVTIIRSYIKGSFLIFNYKTTWIGEQIAEIGFRAKQAKKENI